MSGYLISLFENIKETKPIEDIGFNVFFEKIKNGFWSEIANQINLITDKETRQVAKKKVPYVTISGSFSERKKDGLKQHSGLIAIDIDNLKVNEIDNLFNRLIEEPICFSCFKSISGQGLCFIVKIDSSKHLDSFKGIEVYLLQKYNIVIDKSCKDISRARFVSYDKNAFFNENSDVFVDFLKDLKIKTPKSLNNVIVGDNDIERILATIQSTRENLTKDSYETRLAIGFSLAEGFGESGRNYFHIICSQSSKYDYNECEKQYNHCLRGGSGVSISTFYHFVKEAGIELVSKTTKEVASITRMQKKAGLSITEIKKALKELNIISNDDFNDVVEDSYKNDILSPENGLNEIEIIEYYLRLNHDFRKNEVSRKIEVDGQEFNETILNSIYSFIKKNIFNKVYFQDIERVIKSDFVEGYNPFKDFIAKNKFNGYGHIDKLIGSVVTIQGVEETLAYLFKKWYVSIVQSALGHHSPLVMVATGKHGCGKTEFFRRLLPKELKSYHAESKLDSGKDDEILMCQKLLVLDDEYAGKSKKDEKRIKELTSKDYFSLREPYGRMNVDLKRLAVLCGTSNEDEVLSDLTGNRRIIAFKIIEVLHNVYNSVDKTDMFMEAYQLIQDGFDCSVIREDIQKLKEYSELIKAESVTREEEFIIGEFEYRENEMAELSNGMFRKDKWTCLELIGRLETEFRGRTNPKTMTMVLRKLGVGSKMIRGLRYWCLVKLDDHEKLNLKPDF